MFVRASTWVYMSIFEPLRNIGAERYFADDRIILERRMKMQFIEKFIFELTCFFKPLKHSLCLKKIIDPRFLSSISILLNDSALVFKL